MPWLVMNNLGHFYTDRQSALWTSHETLGLRFHTETEAQLFIDLRFPEVEIDALTIQPTNAPGLDGGVH